MKEEKLISFYEGTNDFIREQVKYLNDSVPGSRTTFMGLALLVENKYMDLFKQKAEDIKVSYTVQGYMLRCTPSELKKSNYLKLGLGIFGRGDWTDEYDTQYEDIRCPECKSRLERIQKSQLTIDKTQFRGKDISTTSNGEIVISEKLKNIFENNDITGVRYELVKHKNSRLKNDFPVYQVFIENILLPLDSSTTYYYNKDSYCDKCRKYCLFPNTYLRYKRENLNNAKDFNYTNEYFYYKHTGEIIISQKVYRILKENKIRGCQFEIVGEV